METSRETEVAWCNHQKGRRTVAAQSNFVEAVDRERNAASSKAEEQGFLAAEPRRNRTEH